MLFQNIVYQLDFFQRNVGYANHLNFLGCSFSFFRFAVLGMRNKTVILSRILISPHLFVVKSGFLIVLWLRDLMIEIFSSDFLFKILEHKWSWKKCSCLLSTLTTASVHDCAAKWIKLQIFLPFTRVDEVLLALYLAYSQHRGQVD